MGLRLGIRGSQGTTAVLGAGRRGASALAWPGLPQLPPTWSDISVSVVQPKTPLFCQICLPCLSVEAPGVWHTHRS